MNGSQSSSLIPSPLIHERISLIMDDMEAVAKGQKNTQQGFAFRGIEQIKNASNPAFRKHKVYYVPEVLEHTKEEKDTQRGGKMTLHTVKVRFKLYTTDGSFVEAVVMGEAADTGDKGLGKAQTYAEKAMLIQVLNIPTEDQSDPDKESHEFTKSKLSPPVQKALPEAKSEAPAQRPKPARDTEQVYDSDYQIQLGFLKDGQPHWLNGMTLEEADHKYNPHVKSSIHKTYDYLTSHHFRNSQIREFIGQYEAYRMHLEKPPQTEGDPVERTDMDDLQF